jgi:peptide/nickel transport system ATP-binding protein
MEAIRLHQQLPLKVAKEKTIRLFEKVKLPEPESLFNRYPHQLSGGQKQRVMIAMAMSCEPSLLICDEPTTALDVTVQKTILELIKELQQSENMGVIFITHDLGVVAEVADRAIVMYKGRIVEEGPVKNMFRQPAHPYTRGLLQCRPVLHEKGYRLPVVSDFLTREDHVPELIANKPSDKGGILLKVENLQVWFPAHKPLIGKPKRYIKAVDNVSFEIFQGETLGLVGESGCGKTTLGRTLLRLVKPTSGRIIYKGADIASFGQPAMRSLRKEMQIVFQDPYSSLNPRLTVGSAIAEPLLVQAIEPNTQARRQKVIELLGKVDLPSSHFDRYPHEFSGGQRQRIVIARALATNPSFLVCDESVSALDVSVQAQVLNLLNDLKSEFGFTIVFISHDLGVVKYFCDRIMVMNKGIIEETGDSETIYRNPQKAYTRRLIDSIPGRNA